MTSVEESDGKGGTTTAGRCRIRISNNELRALQVFLVVDFSTHQVLHTHRVDDERHTLIFNLTVAFLDRLIKGEAVLKTRATAAGDKHSQLEFRISFLFNQLTYNTDPNLGNVLIDKNWKIWIIDYTRAFRIHGHLLKPEGLTVIDRKLLDSMRAMTPDSVKAAMGDTLTRREQRALLERRDKIVQLFEDKIAAQGADVIVYDEP